MSIKEISTFVFAGKAIFTIRNKKTGNRFTFKVTVPKDKKDNPTLWFVSVLTGPDNLHDYSYAGVVDRKGFRRTAKSKMSSEALSFKAFGWLHDMMVQNKELPEYVEFFHEGRCGRCGRRLTTPESVSAGFGPECINFI